MILTFEDKQALEFIDQAEKRGNGSAAVEGPTHRVNDTAFINHRTVDRLLRKYLVEAESYEGRWDAITITDRGREWLAQSTGVTPDA